MAYTADDALSQDATFTGRIRMSMCKAALSISNEARTIHNNVDSKRNTLAKAVLNDPTSYVNRFTHAAIEASALTSASTDAQLDTAISTAWNGIAGVTTDDLA